MFIIYAGFLQSLRELAHDDAQWRVASPGGALMERPLHLVLRMRLVHLLAAPRAAAGRRHSGQVCLRPQLVLSSYRPPSARFTILRMIQRFSCRLILFSVNEYTVRLRVCYSA